MSENNSEHPPGEIELLLPFLVNGTLDDDERNRVEAALADDPRLAREAEIAADLRAGIRDLEDPRTPGEFGLARLMRDIGREAEARAQSSDKTAAHQTDPNRIRALPRYALALAASVALVAAGLTALTQTGFLGDHGGNPGAGDYHQASGSSGNGNLSVAFTPTASQAQVTELLLDHDLVVVDGPSAIGIYRLAVSQDTDPATVADELRQASGVVENVGVSE